MMLFFIHVLCLSQTRRSLCPSVLPAPTRINRLLLCPDQITVASCWKWVVVGVWREWRGVHARSGSAAPQGSFRGSPRLPTAPPGSRRCLAASFACGAVYWRRAGAYVDGKSGAVITWGPERRACERVRARVKRVRKGGCVCVRVCRDTGGPEAGGRHKHSRTWPVACQCL